LFFDTTNPWHGQAAPSWQLRQLMVSILRALALFPP
jgi:hypothetical protein